MSRGPRPVPIVHGTVNGYVNKSCRCGRCTLANRRHWQENSAQMRANVRRIKLEKQAKLQAMREEQGCAVGVACEGELEFDHVDASTKEYNIAGMKTMSWDKIHAELAKCQVLCRKHHIEKTVKEGDYVRQA